MQVETGRHLVAEGDDLCDVAVQRDMQHPVVMSVGHEQLTFVGLHRILDAGGHDDRHIGRVGGRPFPEVHHRCRRCWSVDAIDPDDIGSADICRYQRDDGVGGCADELDVHHTANTDQRQREARSKQTGRTRFSVDAGDRALHRLGDVQRPIRPDGRPRSTAQAGDQHLRSRRRAGIAALVGMSMLAASATTRPIRILNFPVDDCDVHVAVPLPAPPLSSGTGRTYASAVKNVPDHVEGHGVCLSKSPCRPEAWC